MSSHNTFKAIPDSPIILEPHHSVQFYAELWSLDETTVRRMFENEPDVLRITKGQKRKNGTREYVTLRIPYSVAERVYRKRMTIIDARQSA